MRLTGDVSNETSGAERRREGTIEKDSDVSPSRRPGGRCNGRRLAANLDCDLGHRLHDIHEGDLDGRIGIRGGCQELHIAKRLAAGIIVIPMRTQLTVRVNWIVMISVMFMTVIRLKQTAAKSRDNGPCHYQHDRQCS